MTYLVVSYYFHFMYTLWTLFEINLLYIYIYNILIIYIYIFIYIYIYIYILTCTGDKPKNGSQPPTSAGAAQCRWHRESSRCLRSLRWRVEYVALSHQSNRGRTSARWGNGLTWHRGWPRHRERATRQGFYWGWWSPLYCESYTRPVHLVDCQWPVTLLCPVLPPCSLLPLLLLLPCRLRLHSVLLRCHGHWRLPQRWGRRRLSQGFSRSSSPLRRVNHCCSNSDWMASWKKIFFIHFT